MGPDEIYIAVEGWKSGHGRDSAIIQDCRGSTVLIAPWWGREITLFDTAALTFRRLPTSVPCGRARFGKEGQILCWQAESGIHALDARTGARVRSYSALSPEDRALVKRYDDADRATSKRLERTGDKTVLAKEKELDDHYHAVVVTPDGALLAAAGPTKALRVWDGPTGKLLGEARLPEAASDLALSDDLAILSVVTEGDVLRFQLPSLALLPKGARKPAAGSPQPAAAVRGRVVGDALVYGLREGMVALRPNKATKAPSLLRFVSGLADGRTDARVLGTKPGERLSSIDISPDGQVVAIATQAGTSLWSTRDGKRIGQTLPEGTVFFGGSFLFVEVSGATRRYTAATGVSLDERKVRMGCRPVVRLAPLTLECPNAGDVARCFRWDAGKEESTFDPKQTPDRIQSSRLVRVGQYRADDEGPPMLKWQFLTAGGRKGELSAGGLSGGDDPVEKALLAETTLLLGKNDQTVVLNLETGRVVAKLPFSIDRCTLSGDGRRLVQRGDYRYVVWQIDPGAKPVRLKEIPDTLGLDASQDLRAYRKLVLDEKGETMLAYDDEGSGRTLVFDLR